MNKAHISDRYQYDMIHYHLKELHWMSFIVIRILVNALICWYNYEVAVLGPLMYSMYALLTIHILEFIFQRQFFYQNRRVHLHSKWIWGVKIVAYPIILYLYAQSYYTTTIEHEHEKLVNVSRQVWIPLDFILTAFFTCYYLGYYCLQDEEDQAKGEQKVHH